jgi:adenine-specific DNA-methyltransferase
MKPNLLQELTDLISSIELYNSDTGILKNKLIEDGLKNDPALLKLLLTNPNLKKHFFTELDNKILIFNSLKFQQFLSLKDFLPDSYTSFSNKIGLTSNGDYISQNKNVVLDFPFKDCILEGGQSKDDTKRKEIFWSEKLAPDEIDVLLEPKILTNIKKYTPNGEAEVTEFNRNSDGVITDNLIIKGNNLIALHSLKKEFKGKVKLIYIDPPYNTGSDSFGYNDKFNHSTWLVFMKNRLEVARELLRDDGVIFVQCDDNEQAYLKVLMDEIFGMDNYLNCVSVKMSTSAGLKMSNIETKLLKIKESIIIFTKMPGKFKLQNIDELYSNKAGYETERSDKYIENIEESFENWNFCTLNQAFQKYARPDQEKFDFVNDNCTRIFNHVMNPSTVKAWNKLSESEKISLKDKVRSYGVAGSGYKYAYNDHVFIPYNPKILDGDIWVDNYSIGGTRTQEGGVEFNNGKKREVLLKRIVNISTNPGDIVLDYHLGSGTTAAVSHKMGRQYIGVEQMDYIETISVERMKKVIGNETTSNDLLKTKVITDYDNGGISKAIDWEGGGEFIYCELKQHNQNFVDRIQAATKQKEIESIWTDIQKLGSMSYKVDLKSITDNSTEFENLSIEDGKKFLMEVLDKNMLYFNLSNIDNADFPLTDNEKANNKSFYKGKK